ncbi:flavin-containing monooxygenase/FMO family protein [Ceratobasidium sp. AG-Ba]|nr:flavin-containing monooxygenase/FMO family protein [Ceratobasidium sp. AG-Ba]QRW07240.1 flavin-containing monooxygenase/FMO family protein [Ceratobasidium sp. AG-Ba]
MPESKPIHIAIIGAGIGGLTAAAYLQNKLGFYDYTIYERSTDVGGTWRVICLGTVLDQRSYNHFSKILIRGALVIFPHTGIQPNPDWEYVWASQSELQKYWRRVSAKHKLDSHIQYESEMVSAVWDEDKKHYTLVIRNTKTQETRKVTAQVVISATGVLSQPRWPDIPGRESFSGPMIHAEHWDHTVSLKGKRVAVVGNGCTGSQIVPEISKDDTMHVTQFCRTPQWYLPRPQTRVAPWVQWMFRHIPFMLKGFRWSLAAMFELLYWNMNKGLVGRVVHYCFEKMSIFYTKKMAPAKYHDQIIPDYPMGCRRVILDPDYLFSLNRPNVELEWGPISEIVTDGIVTKSGKKIDVDVICFATGFEIEKSLTLNVTGANGQTLSEYYKKEGGPTGYMGTTIPGFPNWVTMFGPNTTTGHASVLFAEEMQMDYVVQLLKPILNRQAKSFVPKAESSRSWNVWVQQQLSQKHVWGSCSSWYRAGGQQGKVVALWAGSTTHMWWSLRKPLLENFEFDGGERLFRGKQSVDFIKLVFWPSALAVVVATYFKAIQGGSFSLSQITSFM